MSIVTTFLLSFASIVDVINTESSPTVGAAASSFATCSLWTLLLAHTNLTRTGLCDYDTMGYHHLILAGPDDSSILIMCHLGALALLEEDELPTWLGLGFMTAHTIGHRCQILAGRDDSSIVIMCH